MTDLEEGRILAIDHGEKRIGLALSDPLGMLATGLDTLEIKAKTDPVAEIKRLCQDNDVIQIVLGLPVSMNGTEGPQAEKVRAFGQALTEAIALPLVFFDERLTSVLAQQVLREQGRKPSEEKGLVDKVAAQRLLQDYLDSRKRKLF